VISGVCDFVCVSVSVRLCVRALKRKRLELSTPNLVDKYSMTGSRHALTRKKVKGQGHPVTTTAQTKPWVRFCITFINVKKLTIGIHLVTVIVLTKMIIYTNQTERR